MKLYAGWWCWRCFGASIGLSLPMLHRERYVLRYSRV
jgi:hypothetical protein